MRIETLLAKRLAEDPKDAQTPGHKLLLRGGYIRQIGQGIYSLLPLGQRACAKVAQIIREEMDRVGMQELLLPVTTPAELWQKSGRYDAIGSELLRFTDRTDHPYVLNMTHEEVVVDTVASQVDSYRQLPLAVYQIQTKFRDEARSRGGLIRVREFTMKDAYSFHRTQEDLEDYYKQCHAAYVRIFQRCGLRAVVDIESDTGMMGGSVAHEFMLLTPVGEDTIVLCDESGYRANREVAVCKRAYDYADAPEPLTEVETPGQKTIEEVSGFLGKTTDRCCKAVAFVAVLPPKKEGGAPAERPVVAFVRGDMEVNPAKLKRALAQRLGILQDLRPMAEDEFGGFGSVAGFVGPIGLTAGAVELVYDESVAKTPNLIIGANRVDWHATGFNFGRDLPEGTPFTDITDVREGDPCPLSGKPLRLSRGIEVGNIFQLGTKYTESMEFFYDEEDGGQRVPIMGCYGIGVGRTMASVLEESHDDHGPIWPITVAPYQVQVCALQAQKDEAVRNTAEAIYQGLRDAGIEVLIDTRKVGAGFMFADADLIGAPVRAIVSPRNLKEGRVEMKFRLAGESRAELPADIAVEGAAKQIERIVTDLLQQYNILE
ncbi:MAG: proline--tRNA ligase [Sumerlaeia bacterium]